MAVEDKNKYGQYFTPKVVADFMVSLLDGDKKGKILEPSCGKGVFLDSLLDAGFKNIQGIEFDEDCWSNSVHKVTYGDYLLKSELSETYDGIIGNPPYIRWKNLTNDLKNNLKKSDVWNKYCSSLSDYSTAFIAKAALDLKDNGTLVFITPEYWLYTYHSQKLRNLLLELGSVDRIYHFDEAPIFDGAIASLVVFRFKKSKKLSTTAWKIKGADLYNAECLPHLAKGETTENYDKIELQCFKHNQRWTLEPEDVANRLNALEFACANNSLLKDKFATIGDICDIGNGMVSGLDKAFQIDEANLNDAEKKRSIKVAKAKQLNGVEVDETTTYIFITEKITEQQLKSECPNFYSRLHPFKSQLEKRYDYKNESKYWNWAFLRNYNTFIKDTQKIFIPCKERIGNKASFRFTIANPSIYPTQDVTGLVLKKDAKESIYYVHAFLKLPIVTEWIKNRGVSRGGVAEFSEAPLSSIPFRSINWDIKREKELHDEIVRLSQLNGRDGNDYSKELDKLFAKLIT